MSVIKIKDEEDFVNNVTKNEEVPDLILAYFTATEVLAKVFLQL